MKYLIKQDSGSHGDFFIVYNRFEKRLVNLYYIKEKGVITITRVRIERPCNNLDLVDIARNIFACDDLESSEIRIGKDVTTELGFEDKECIFQIEDLLHGHSIILSAEPTYMGGESVPVAKVESLTDARHILNNLEILDELGIDTEEFYIVPSIVKNISITRQTKKMDLFGNK